jgi:hypothetical protein
VGGEEERASPAQACVSGGGLEMAVGSARPGMRSLVALDGSWGFSALG